MESCRVNFPGECENLMNQVVGALWSAEQTYTQIASQCAGDHISMLGFCDYFRLCGLRMRSVAEKLIRFQTMRGGRLVLGEIRNLFNMPSVNEATVEKFMHMSVEIEKHLENILLELDSMARSKNDVITSEFIECNLLRCQADMVKTAVNHLNNLNASENTWLYDTLAMRPYVEKIYTMLESTSTNSESSTSVKIQETMKEFSGLHGQISNKYEDCMKSFVKSLRR